MSERVGPTLFRILRADAVSLFLFGLILVLPLGLGWAGIQMWLAQIETKRSYWEVAQLVVPWVLSFGAALAWRVVHIRRTFAEGIVVPGQIVESHPNWPRWPAAYEFEWNGQIVQRGLILLSRKQHRRLAARTAISVIVRSDRLGESFVWDLYQ
nr:hypothetical protein [uncultured bacterium]